MQTGPQGDCSVSTDVPEKSQRAAVHCSDAQMGLHADAHHKGPCATRRGVFLRLKEALALPPSCAEQARQSSLGYLLGQGERHILPSFFNLLKHLQAQVRVESLPMMPETAQHWPLQTLILRCARLLLRLMYSPIGTLVIVLGLSLPENCYWYCISACSCRPQDCTLKGRQLVGVAWSNVLSKAAQGIPPCS